MTDFRISNYGLIDRERPVRFKFDGRVYSGYEGDSLASALLAHGVMLMGRSFKYHRPRGVLAAGSEEPNALVCWTRGAGRKTPNLRATQIQIYDGMEVHSQNCWPGLKWDIGAVNNLLSELFPAGFYNKTFMWPKGFWDRLYEPLIRKMAGLGPPPDRPDPDLYASSYGHCETLIVGGGAAGLAAALSAAKAGGRVMVVDEGDRWGGGLLSQPGVHIQGLKALDWVAQTLEILRSASNVTLMLRTTALGYYHDNFIALAQQCTDHIKAPDHMQAREKLHRIRAGHVILAQGATARPLVFDGNDRPGIMLASAAQAYLHIYGVAIGKKIALLTSHDSAYQSAFDLKAAGVNVVALIDLRQKTKKSLQARAQNLGISTYVGHSVNATRGLRRIKAVELYQIQSRKRRWVLCDSLLVCGGWTPNLHLWSHARGTLRWDRRLKTYMPDQCTENVTCVGACAGQFQIAAAMSDAAQAGGIPITYKVREPDFGRGEIFEMVPSYKSASRQKAFVDFQNDVTAKDIALAVREGFKSVEHVKRYTTNGMATDQGKTSNLNALNLIAKAVDKPVDKVGITTFRPPYTPVTFGTMVGHRSDELFAVTRKPPIDDWAAAQGAVFEPVGLWRRARYFPHAGENMHQAVARECRATRESLGIFDASTLGKIEVVGPDAAEFMERMYTNSWHRLAVGRCRYGVMLREDGYIYDDGVIGRLAEDRFHVTTTSGGAPGVYRHMEDYLQTEFTDLNVWLTSTTEQWAVIAINGPNARKLIAPFVAGIDLSPEAFGHMAVREGQICDVPTRLFRVSFTGELGFEINVPAHFGRAVWDRLFAAGTAYDICPYGTETMHVLRAEKGFIIVGQDTDGTVTPYDAGMAWAVSKAKPDFVGKRSLARPDLKGQGRKQLVGLMTDNPEVILQEGAQIVTDPSQPKPMNMIGHVSSSYWSASLGHSIALALVEDGFKRKGETLYVPMPEITYKVKVTSTQFYDPEGERLNVV